MQTTLIFQLIHIDIWGAYRQHSISRGHYVITIADDFSRATWAYLMQHKAQTTKILDTFCKMVLNKFKTSTEVVRFDNRVEI